MTSLVTSGRLSQKQDGKESLQLFSILLFLAVISDIFFFFLRFHINLLFSARLHVIGKLFFMLIRRGEYLGGNGVAFFRFEDRAPGAGTSIFAP